MLEASVLDLKDVIAEHDGANVADSRFCRRVDDLLSVFYDDVDAITTVPTRCLFDLFVIKVLYVERRGTAFDVVNYLGQLLEQYLPTLELVPEDREGRTQPFYFSDLVRQTQELTSVHNRYEAFRSYGDRSLFVTGVFPQSLHRRRGNRTWASASLVDRTYYVSTGKQSYIIASQHDVAEAAAQRSLLEKLATYFEIYVDALNEMSDRYLMGFDFALIADKMLDSFNRYRTSGDERYLTSARRYAAILMVAPEAFPALMRRSGPDAQMLPPAA